MSFAMADKSWIPCSEFTAIGMFFTLTCFMALSNKYDYLALLSIVVDFVSTLPYLIEDFPKYPNTPSHPDIILWICLLIRDCSRHAYQYWPAILCLYDSSHSIYPNGYSAVLDRNLSCVDPTFDLFLLVESFSHVLSIFYLAWIGQGVTRLGPVCGTSSHILWFFCHLAYLLIYQSVYNC